MTDAAIFNAPVHHHPAGPAHQCNLRPCARNSEQSAARIVALTLIASGEVKPCEVAALEAIRAHELLGLTREAWHDVVHALCADLLLSATRRRDCVIDSTTIKRLLSDVDDIALQRLVLRVCATIIDADGQIDDAEIIVLKAVFEHWGLLPNDQELPASAAYGSDFQIVLRESQQT